MMTHIGLLQPTNRKNFPFLKIQDGGGRHNRKIEKLYNLSNGLADLHKIWHYDAEYVR